MEKSKQFFKQPKVRASLVVLIIAATIVIFAHYLLTHPKVIQTLIHLPPLLLVVLGVGYVAAIASNAYVLHASLLLIGTRAPYADNILLTGYSSIINFFGPLQSGPGARALYLKTKYNVRIRDFLGTALVFYAFFAVINCLILGIAAIRRFPSVLGISLVALAVLFGIVLFIILFTKSSKFNQLIRSLKFHDKHFWQIGLGACLLIISTAGIYYAELQHVVSSVSIWQALIYSAAANLALFVSLTPGAIGFREGFLVFSEKLHGLDTATVLSASIIDRAFYIVFLAVLFVAIIIIARVFHLSFFVKGKVEKATDR